MAGEIGAGRSFVSRTSSLENSPADVHVPVRACPFVYQKGAMGKGRFGTRFSPGS